MIRKFHQSVFKALGEESCNACCLVRVAYDFLCQKDIPLVEMAEWITKGIDKGFIEFNPDDIENKRGLGKQNLFVRDPCGFLKLITKKNWEYRFEGSDYIPKVNEYEIDFWAKSVKNGSNGIGHFTTPSYNSLQFSETVEKGFIYTKRICKVFS